LGIDSGNGGEFINHQLKDWCDLNHIPFTRGRPYRKNDNCLRTFGPRKMENGKALRKRLVMAFMTAVQILQLRQEREGKTEQEPLLVFSEEQVACMEDLAVEFEGKREKQKNQWPKNNVAWAGWDSAAWGLEGVYKPASSRGDNPLRGVDGSMLYFGAGWSLKMCYKHNRQPSGGELGINIRPGSDPLGIFMQKCV
jgi:hypothetical protein